MTFWSIHNEFMAVVSQIFQNIVFFQMTMQMLFAQVLRIQSMNHSVTTNACFNILHWCCFMMTLLCCWFVSCVYTFIIKCIAWRWFYVLLRLEIYSCTYIYYENVEIYSQHFVWKLKSWITAWPQLGGDCKTIDSWLTTMCKWF